MPEALRAFTVTSVNGEAGTIVWTTTRAKAKRIAMSTSWHCDEDWRDLRCRREPKADAFRKTEGCVGDEPTKDEQRLMRDLGWFEIEGASEPCDDCGLFDWSNVPESAIGEDGLCVYCHNEKLKRIAAKEREAEDQSLR